MRIHTTHTRDAALRELSRINRWLLAGSVVLTGVFADVAANAFPGRKATTGTASKRGRSKVRTNQNASGSHKTYTRPLQPPAQAPQPVTETPSSQETTQTQEPAPAQETAPAPEPTEASTPVISGGS
jgi:hypothetical protein